MVSHGGLKDSSAPPLPPATPAVRTSGAKARKWRVFRSRWRHDPVSAPTSVSVTSKLRTVRQSLCCLNSQFCGNRPGLLGERLGFWCSCKLGPSTCPLSTCPQHDWTKVIVKSRERFIQCGHTGKSRSWGPDPTTKPVSTPRLVFLVS